MKSCIFFLISFSIFHHSISQTYEEGYYTSYDDSTHFGLIKVLSSDNGFKFKVDSTAEEVKITTKEAKHFAIGDKSFYALTFKPSYPGVKLFPPSDSESRASSFKELIEKGKINIYASSSMRVDLLGSPSSMTVSQSAALYIEKGDLVEKLTSDYGPGIKVKKWGLLKKYVKDDSVFLMKVESGVYQGKDWETVIRDYNNRHKLFSEREGTLTIFRGSKKQLDSKVTINIDGNDQIMIPLDTIFQLTIDDITNFSLCIGEDPNCEYYSGSLVTKNYIEISVPKKSEMPDAKYVDEIAGEYYEKRIAYLMSKRNK